MKPPANDLYSKFDSIKVQSLSSLKMHVTVLVFEWKGLKEGVHEEKSDPQRNAWVLVLNREVLKVQGQLNPTGDGV